jgi:hypothetical protein
VKVDLLSPALALLLAVSETVSNCSSPRNPPAAVPTPTPENLTLYRSNELLLLLSFYDRQVKAALEKADSTSAQYWARKRVPVLEELRARGVDWEHQAPAEKPRVR